VISRALFCGAVSAVFLSALGSCASAPAAQPQAPAQGGPSSQATAPASATTPSAHYVAPETPDAPFRAHAPALADVSPAQEPPVRVLRLANGIPVLFLERHEPGYVRVEAMLRARHEVRGANTMAARGLWLATSAAKQGRLTLQSDADFAQNGSTYAWGWIRATLTSTSDDAPATIARFADIVLHATYPANEVVRITRDAARELEQQDEAPRAIAARVLPMALYGQTEVEDEVGDLRSTDVGALRRQDTFKAYEDALDPGTMRLLVVGDVTEKTLRPLLDKTFGSWTAPRKSLPVEPKPVVLTSTPRVVVVDHPGARALVLVGGEGPAYASTDWAPAVTLRALLAGSRGALARALQDEHASFANSTVNLAANPSRPRAGFMSEVPTNEVAPTLAAFDRVLRDARSLPLQAADLDEARHRMAVAEPSWLSTLAGAEDLLEGLVVHGLPPDDVATRRAKLLAVRADDLHRVAARYFDPAHMKVVLVGDWSAMRASVRALGLGDVEVRDSSGKVLRVERASAP
jgi:predicted Zn-dependent peptidase